MAAVLTDGIITNDKLATDVKIGSLSTLTTAAKGNVVAAINELTQIGSAASSSGGIDTDGTLKANAVDVAAVLRWHYHHHAVMIQTAAVCPRPLPPRANVAAAIKRADVRIMRWWHPPATIHAEIVAGGGHPR